MKVFAFLQMMLGGFATFSSWELAQLKAHTDLPPIPRPMPTDIFEFVLLFLGLSIVACGFLLQRANVKYCKLQIISGLLIAIISALLGIRAVAFGYGGASGIYYISYLLLALGILIFVTGFMQLINSKKLIRTSKFGEKTSG